MHIRATQTIGVANKPRARAHQQPGRGRELLGWTAGGHPPVVAELHAFFIRRIASLIRGVYIKGPGPLCDAGGSSNYPSGFFMIRIYLALACFFSLLFRGRLPLALEEDRFVHLLPAPPSPEVIAAPEAPAAPAPAPAKPSEKAADKSGLRNEGALALLALLQREGRLVDFLRESLDTYSDADIGAAVRDVHRGCRKVMEEHLKLEPVLPGQEESNVVVPPGFDPVEVRLLGETRGAPPFRGTLVHHGWRAIEVRFPHLSDGVDRRVLAPAEVKVA